MDSCNPPGWYPGAPVDNRSFLVRAAVARGHGVGALRHHRWHRPFTGVRSRSPLADTLRGRALQYLPRLRTDDHFSHATSLALLGVPIRVAAGRPVDVSSPVESGLITCRGVSGHRYRIPSRRYDSLHPELDAPVPVSAPLDAVRECGLELPFAELVVALDHLLLVDSARFDRGLHISAEALARYTQAAKGRGAVRFRAAAALARVGAESRMETLMRLCGEAAGMPELTLQKNVYDGRGNWIGRFDAVDEETGSIFEFDGDQHLVSRLQRRRDAVKLQAARDAGWRIKVLYAEDVIEDPLGTGQRMLAFCGRGPRRVTPSRLALLLERSGSDTEPACSF